MAQIIRDITDILRQHRRLVTVTTGAFVAVAAACAVMKPTVWTARQALIVRDEVRSEVGGLGRFESTDAMQTAQETILEIARYRSVVEKALHDIGPPSSWGRNAWPTSDDIESAQKNIEISAPRGAQFGRTELIYLVVNESSPERAVAFNEAVCKQMDARLKHVRNNKYRSVIDELIKGVALAEAEAKTATKAVQELEQSVGPDLPQLRSMAEAGGADGPLTRSLAEIKNELRQAKTQREAQGNLLQLLEVAQRDSAELLATPNQLLEQQPSLRRLKDGLVDAQLRTAQLAGSRSKDHPEVRSAVQAEERIRKELFAEIAVAIRGLQSDREISARKIELLGKQLADAENRLDRLAKIRAEYTNLVSDARNKTTNLERIRSDLSSARANELAATEVSLLARVDHAVADPHPKGPSRKSLVLLGLFLGLGTSAGIVCLIEPRLGGMRTGLSALLQAGRETVSANRPSRQGIGGRRATDPQTEASAKEPAERRKPSQPGRRDSDYSVRNVPPPLDLPTTTTGEGTPTGA